MKAPKKPIKTKEIEVMALPQIQKETQDISKETSTKELKEGIKTIYKKLPKQIKSHLRFSAAQTIEVDKGYINAVGCRTVYPEGPSIGFNPTPNDFSGKIDLWMKNVNKGESFAISFRVLCAYDGQWEIRSSETHKNYVNIAKGYQTIDFFIPNVKSDYGLVLITLEPQFDNYGAWMFFDATVKKVTFN